MGLEGGSKLFHPTDSPEPLLIGAIIQNRTEQNRLFI